MSDEFYIGYEPEMPPELAARMRRVARGLIACGLLLPTLVVVTVDRSAEATFEFGRVRTFHGQIVESPYPALTITDSTRVARTHWLVGQGKHGAADLVRGRHGQHVAVSGSLIQRDRDVMIEIAPGAITVTDAGTANGVEPFLSHGVVNLVGEIVDSKCHLGVMKPGEGPTHRDCAVRCLLGRIPPMFAPDDGSKLGRVSIVTEHGHAFVNPGAWAGRRVSVRGEVLQRGAQTFLAVSPHEIRLLD
jgi:hypothetical protein